MADEIDVAALLAELGQERKLREGLEVRINTLAAEKDAAERATTIRAELQKLGITKVDLAYKAVREDVAALGGVELTEFLARFVGENPELLPARLAGGSGATSGQKGGSGAMSVDLDKIRPGMNGEEMDRIRQEIARVASLTLRGI
jgi:hypothetical protein